MNEIVKESMSFSPAKVSLQNVKACRLPYTANQMWLMVRFFPSMFGCFFNEDDLVWNVLLTHCELVEYLMTPFIPQNSIEHIRFLIVQQNEFSVSYHEICKYKCKLHILSHYPDLIRLYGSIVMFSTIRFESLHRYFKRLMRKINLYKKRTLDVVYTLSTTSLYFAVRF